MSLKDKLYNQIRAIKDSDIQEFVKEALSKVDPKFWTAPCSSTGKNHPPEDNGRGGLVRHTIKTAHIAYELARLYEKNYDIVVAGALLHDIHKNGIPWEERTDYTHGLITYNFLGQFKLKQPEKINIMNCVRWHMGKWVEPKETELEGALRPLFKEIEIVQLADYFSSRSCASFLPGISLTKEQINRYSNSLIERKISFLQKPYECLENYVRNMRKFFKKVFNSIK